MQITDCFKPIFDTTDPDKVIDKGINIEYIYTSSSGLLIMKVGEPQEAVIKLTDDLGDIFPKIPANTNGGV
jgi:hypothetical protein